MDRRRSDQNDLPRTMSTLLSGSIADEHSPTSNRDQHLRFAEPFDPFLSAPSNRYSPPRTILLESPVLEKHAQFHSSPLYTNSSTTRGDEIVGYRHQDGSYLLHDPRHEQSTHTKYQNPLDYHAESTSEFEHGRSLGTNRGQRSESGLVSSHQQTRRRPVNQDEFDGPSQYLPLPLPQDDHCRTLDLPELPVHLDIAEQEVILRRYNDVLADCAFHFVAKYQFPIPLERERHPVRGASDREWTEWAYLLKRLATKRRIPARILYANQIKQLVTILENSVPVRHSVPRDQLNTRKAQKDDRYILQLVSAGIQVARILMDSLAMQQLVDLYTETETVLKKRCHCTQAGQAAY